MIDFCDLSALRSLMKMGKILLILVGRAEGDVFDAEWDENVFLEVVLEI